MWKSVEFTQSVHVGIAFSARICYGTLWHGCSDSRGDFRQEMICRLLDLLDLEPAAPDTTRFLSKFVEVCVSSVGHRDCSIWLSVDIAP